MFSPYSLHSSVHLAIACPKTLFRLLFTMKLQRTWQIWWNRSRKGRMLYYTCPSQSIKLCKQPSILRSKKKIGRSMKGAAKRCSHERSKLHIYTFVHYMFMWEADCWAIWFLKPHVYSLKEDRETGIQRVSHSLTRKGIKLCKTFTHYKT